MMVLLTAGLAALVVAGLSNLVARNPGPNRDLVEFLADRAPVRIPPVAASVCVATIEAVVLAAAAVTTAMVVVRPAVPPTTKVVVVAALVVGTALVTPALARRLGRSNDTAHETSTAYHSSGD